MTTLSVDEIAAGMIGAAAPALESAAPRARAYLALEMGKLAQTLVEVGRSRARGLIDAAEARLLVDMQRNAARSVLIAAEVIGAVAAEAALDAALEFARGPVNAALGWKLL